MERKEAIARLKTIVGQELHHIAKQYNVTVNKDGKVNKGWAGHIFERFLELPINSAQSPNFGSWELKSIPIKTLKNGKKVIKETMAITMIDPINVCQKDFADSHLLAKLKKVVLVARTVGQTVDDPSYIHSIIEFDLQGELYHKVKTDYDLIREILLDPKQGFDSLTGKMGVYIQPRTKGTGHGSKTRAFYARKKFLQAFIRI